MSMIVILFLNLLASGLSLNFLATEITEQTFSRCGLKSDANFYNWALNLENDAPVLYPKTDKDLTSILKSIHSNNCKARPVGATHSAGGLVMENEEANTVGVSLAKYSTDDSAWNGIVNTTVLNYFLYLFSIRIKQLKYLQEEQF